MSIGKRIGKSWSMQQPSKKVPSCDCKHHGNSLMKLCHCVVTAMYMPVNSLAAVCVLPCTLLNFKRRLPICSQHSVTSLYSTLDQTCTAPTSSDLHCPYKMQGAQKDRRIDERTPGLNAGGLSAS